jgi:hypothetical protein
MDSDRLALASVFRGDLGKMFETCHKFRTAVGIARIVKGINSDEQVARTHCLAPSKRQREEYEIPCRHVRDRDTVTGSALRHCDVGGKRRATKLTKIEREHDMPLDSDSLSDAACVVEFDTVPLVIVDGKG